MRLKAGLADSPACEGLPSASLQPGLFKANFPRSTTNSPQTSSLQIKMAAATPNYYELYRRSRYMSPGLRIATTLLQDG